MAYVRVSAQVLLWTDPTDPGKARQEIFQFLVPCAEGLTIEEFESEAKNRFAGIRAWKGLGPLKINYLTDYWDNVLDRDLIVGHVFKDDKGVEDRICKVVQLPLTPEELRNLQRYGSVVLEAAARPRKHLRDPSSPRLHSDLRKADCERNQESEPSERNGRLHKRQKTHDSRLYDKSDYDRPIPSREGLEGGLYISSQSSGRRSSPVNQVVDSQKSPRTKQPNPYGTPTSLTVNSPLKQATIKDHPFSIPDSPPGRAASFSNHNSYIADDLELRNTKSESPELTSVFELPLDDIAAITERESALKTARINGNQVIPSQIPQLDGRQAQNSDRAEVSRCSTNTALPLSAEATKTEIVHFAKPNLPSSRGPPAKTNRHHIDGVRAHSLDILDRIETDIESSQASQHARSAKRLRHGNALLKMSSPPVPSDYKEQACEQNPFVIPPFPRSYPKAAAILGSDENANYSDPGANTHLRVEVPTLIPSGFQKDVAPNVVHHALVPQKQQQIDEPLPWEIQGEDQLVRRKTPELPEQAKEDITRGETPFTVQKEEELRANNSKEVEALNLKELKSVKDRASKTTPVGEVPAHKTSSADLKVKEKLVLQRKAVEEKAGRNEPVGNKGKVEKLEDEKLTREQKSREADAAQRRAWQRELAALNKAKNAKNAGKNVNKQRALADFEKAQATKEVSMNVESGTKDLPKEPEVSHKVVTGTKRKATSLSLESRPAKTPTLDERSDIRNRKSSTPSSMRSDPDRVRSSMTPAVPGGTKKLSDPGNSTVTSRLSAHAPLRSALRQNSSVPRRSVSFVEEPSDPTKLDSSPSMAAAGKLIASKSKRSQSGVAEDECKSRASSTVGSTVSMSSDTPKQSRELSTKPVSKEKVQTKLNVKRDKKMKGREIDRPKFPEPVFPDETIISSDSEKSVSTFYSDEEDRPRNAKAGPSSKKKPSPAGAEAAATTKPFTPDTPASEPRQSSSQDAGTPSRKLSPEGSTRAPTRAKSPSRSPAQYMSREKSVSSGLESGSGSGSESEPESGSGSGSGSESGSESGSPSESEPKLPALPQVEKPQGKAKPPLLKSGGSGDVEMEDASTQSSSSKSVSQSSQCSSVASKVLKKSNEDDGRRLAQDADQQLRRECHQSLDPSGGDLGSSTAYRHNVKAKPPTSAKKPVDPNHPVRQRGKPSSGTKRESSKENSNALPKPAIEPDKPSGKTLRPTNQRYSSINELMKQPKAEVRSHASTQKPAGSRVAATSVADYSESSSGDSEDSSTSDDDVPANGANRNRTISKNKAASGFKGVMKLARQVRARGIRQ